MAQGSIIYRIVENVSQNFYISQHYIIIVFFAHAHMHARQFFSHCRTNTAMRFFNFYMQFFRTTQNFHLHSLNTPKFTVTRAFHTHLTNFNVPNCLEIYFFLHFIEFLILQTLYPYSYTIDGKSV